MGRLVRSATNTVMSMLANNIHGAGSVTQDGSSLNRIALSGNNDYTGATTVKSELFGGRQRYTAFGHNSDVSISLGAVLRLNEDVHDFDIAVGSLNGAGYVTMTGIHRGNTLTIGHVGDGLTVDTVFSGRLNDAQALFLR